LRVALLLTHDLSLDSSVQKFVSTLTKNGHEAYVLSSSSDSVESARIFSFTRKFIESIDEEVIERIWSKLPKFVRQLITSKRVKIQQKRVEQISTMLCEKLLSLNPDLVHANDPDTLMAAHQYFVLRDVPYVYDSHEDFDSLQRTDPAWSIVMSKLESQFIHEAKHVVTVSLEIAETLERKYRLQASPFVVMNTPEMFSTKSESAASDIRKVLNLDESEPLHIYIGSATPRRGLKSFIDALKKLQSHKGALLLPNSSYARKLKRYVSESGLQDRVWILPYVEQNQLLSFISTATSGVSPLLHYPNHEVSCFTKFYEYLNAGIPIVTSDVRTMANTVRREKVGFVYSAGNVDELVRALELVTEQSLTLKQFISENMGTRFVWEAQESVIEKIYGYEPIQFLSE
jgi:glycosyltransferase involved in cell wall biosynthesis